MVSSVVISSDKEELAGKSSASPAICITEDVLSRGLPNLVPNNKTGLIKASKNMVVPSYTLYVDDIMIFF